MEMSIFQLDYCRIKTPGGEAGIKSLLNFASKVQLFSEFLNLVFKKPDLLLYFKKWVW